MWHYLEHPDVEKTKLLNLEREPFAQMYLDGVSAYENEQYSEAVMDFEDSLRSYLKSEEDCRLFCEGSFDQGWHPEFTASIASKSKN